MLAGHVYCRVTERFYNVLTSSHCFQTNGFTVDGKSSNATLLSNVMDEVKNVIQAWFSDVSGDVNHRWRKNAGSCYMCCES